MLYAATSRRGTTSPTCGSRRHWTIGPAFVGFAAGEPTPERTAFVRFRAELVRRGLDARGVVVRMGTLVDAPLLPPASIQHDGEARWAAHRSRKPTHGYKAHVATDQDAVLIRGVEVTTANVHDAAELSAVLPDMLGDVYGDSAFAGSRSEAAIRARGGTPRVGHTGIWGGPKALVRLQAYNAEVSRVRGRIERVFGTCKRCYGLRRMRWLSLARAGLQVRLAAMAYMKLALACGLASVSHVRILPVAQRNAP